MVLHLKWLLSLLDCIHSFLCILLIICNLFTQSIKSHKSLFFYGSVIVQISVHVYNFGKLVCVIYSTSSKQCRSQSKLMSCHSDFLVIKKDFYCCLVQLNDHRIVHSTDYQNDSFSRFKEVGKNRDGEQFALIQFFLNTVICRKNHILDKVIAGCL